MMTLTEEIEYICFEKNGYPIDWPIHDACPGCGGNNHHGFAEKYGMTYDQCKTCDLVFMNPYPSKAVVSEIYNGSYYTGIRKFIEIPNEIKHKMNASVSNDDLVYEDIIKRVSKYLKKRCSWLDFGGGTGYFLNKLRLKHQEIDCYLLEENEVSAKHAKTFYELKVLGSLSNEEYSFVSAISVLEHIAELKEFFSLISKHIDSDSILLLSVPNYSKLNSYFAKEKSYNFIPPYHVSLFNEKALRMLLEKNGFKIIEMWDEGKSAFDMATMIDSYRYYDVIIPRFEQNMLTSIESTPYPFIKKVISLVLINLGRVLQPAIVSLDGRATLNVIVKRII